MLLLNVSTAVKPIGQCLQHIENLGDHLIRAVQRPIERQPLQQCKGKAGGYLEERPAPFRLREEIEERSLNVLGKALCDVGNGGTQLGIGSRRDGELEPGVEGRTGHDRPQQIDRRRLAVRTRRQLTERSDELVMTALKQMFDRGQNQVGLGREVMQLRPARYAGTPGDLGRRGLGVTELVEARDCGIEQLGPCGRGALLLSTSDSNRFRSRLHELIHSRS